ncbi:MAG TPA: ATP-dependent helicase [Acidimicrobiales bacterium]|nr:ATP-dependent helicase [Acidimicrobiales bacterium]
MFDTLTEAQATAVDHGDSPLLVFAGAGSGKTRTLAGRVARLLERGVPPERICLLTFSRRAAAEMLARVGPAAGRVWGGTFHAVANRMLRRHGRLVGLDPAFTVADAADAVDLLALVRADLGLAAESRPTGRRFPSADSMAAIASRVVNAQERLPDVVAARFPWCRGEIDGIRECFVAYTARKRSQHVLDLDDLLLFWQALARSPEGAAVTADAFDHVLVDEYQDTNALQADILDALRPGGRGLTVVGDDAQAIYGFRAATPRNILDFETRYPGTTLVRLADNHRSTPPIVAVANAVMAASAPGHWSGTRVRAVRSGTRRPLLRTCADEATQATAVCDSVLAHRDQDVPLRRQAVLFRASWHADLLELELSRRNVPYVKYGGLRFLEAAHVKDLLALLRLLDNPWDELAWSRTLRLLDGVGPVTARRLTEALGVRAGTDSGAATPLAQLLAAAPDCGAAAAESVGALRAALADCLALGPAPAPQVERLCAFLVPIVRRRYDNPDPRLADLAGPPGLDEDWLTLSTVHSAKGGEWDVVHVIHAADGCFPSDMATGSVEELEEERRLFYVACTRARNVLEISWPLRYHHNRQHPTDRHGWAQLSRLVNPDVDALLDSTTAAPPIPDDPPSDGGAVATVDVRLNALWA